MDNFYLIYVNPVGKNGDGVFEYDFYFSENYEEAYGEDWGELCPSACENTLPYDDCVTARERLKTEIPIFCIQQNSCFSITDCTDGIVALAHEDISEYDEYPEPYRLVFRFGMEKTEVDEMLRGRKLKFENNGEK